MSDDNMDLWPGPDEAWEDAAASAGLFLPWPGSMALIRIGEDTAYLAGHLAATGHIDDPDVICACKTCLAGRREILEQGRTAAEQEILNQERQSADARAHVTRDLAGYGASPYPSSRGIDITAAYHPRGCRCDECGELRAAIGKLAGRDKHISRLMNVKARTARKQARHDQDEPGRACCFSPEGCQGHQAPAPQGWVPTMEWAATAPCSCGQAPDSMDWQEHAFGRCMRRMAISEVKRYEAEQWWEVTRSAILPDFGHFVAKIPDQPPGTCRECRTGPLYAGQLCWYCNLLGEREAFRLAPPRLKPAPAPLVNPAVRAQRDQERDARRAARQKRIAARKQSAPLRGAVTMAVLGFALMVLSVHIPALGLLIVPGIILLIRGFVKGRRL